MEEQKPKRKYVRKETKMTTATEALDNTVYRGISDRIKPAHYICIFPVNKISYDQIKLAIDSQNFFVEDEKVLYIPTVNDECSIRENWCNMSTVRHVIRYNPVRFNEITAREFIEKQNVFGPDDKILYLPNGTDAIVYEILV